MMSPAPGSSTVDDPLGDADGERFLARPGLAVCVGATLVAVVGLMAVFVPAEPFAIDRRWAEAMQDTQTPLLHGLARVFDFLGRGLGVVLALVGIAVVLCLARRWRALLAFTVVEALAPLSSSLLKAATQRARPPDGVVHPHGTSFPSGHTTYAGAICVALVLLFSAPGPRRRRWWALAGLGIVGMGWSRTYLQVHWLSDVIAGALLGIGISLLVFGATQRRGQDRPSDGDGLVAGSTARLAAARVDLADAAGGRIARPSGMAMSRSGLGSVRRS
jgi:undecaprenyl-diphosphatase